MNSSQDACALVNGASMFGGQYTDVTLPKVPSSIFLFAKGSSLWDVFNNKIVFSYAKHL